MKVFKDQKLDETTKMLKIKELSQSNANKKLTDNQMVASVKAKLSILKELTN